MPQAIKLFEQVRDVQLKTLGANHPHTLSTLTNLAAAYKNTGKVPLAIQLYKQAWDVQVKTLGADHPDTLFTLHYLAGAYRADGKLSEAIALFKQVHEARATKLGAEHTDTLITLNNLALAYYAVGKPSKAIELLKQAHDSLVKKLGAGHPHTLRIGNNLAQAYQGTGRPEQALPLFRQAAVEYEKQKFLHPAAERIVGNLSTCHEALKQYPEAEAWRRKWLAVVKEQAGDQSPTYAGGLVLLGVNLLKQKKWTEAEQVLRECCTLREKLAKGPKPAVLSWQVASVKSMLGEALAGQMRYADAEPLLLQGYQEMKKHEVTIPLQSRVWLTVALNRLVRLYEAWDKKDEAARWKAKLPNKK